MSSDPAEWRALACAMAPHRPFRKMATGRAHGATFRSRGADSESSHLICILRAADSSNFYLFSPASEGWLKRSERNELLGIASNNLKLKPTTHRNKFTSLVKAHKAITTRVVTGPTKSLALHTVTCFFRFQSRNFAVFLFL